MIENISETKSQHSPQVIQFPEDQSRSPTPKSRGRFRKTRDEVISSFGAISQTPTMDHPKQKTDNGPQLLLLSCDRTGLTFIQDNQIRNLLSGVKARFVVEIVVGTESEQRVTVVNKSFHNGINRCRYYVLRCYINIQPTTSSYSLVKFAYQLATYICLMHVNETSLTFLANSLRNTNAPLHKYNHLILVTADQYQSSTSYQTTTNLQTTNQFSQQTSKQIEISTYASKLQKSKHSRYRVSEIKHVMLSYFTNMSSTPYIARVKSLIQEEKLNGLYYQLGDLRILADKVNNNTFSTRDFSGSVLRNNLGQKISKSKTQYIGLSKLVYSSGTSIEFAKLRVFLTEIYSAVMDSFDREFQGFESLEDFQIHRSILQRWIQLQEQNINEVNSILNEHRSSKILQTSTGITPHKQTAIETLFTQSQGKASCQGVNIEALMTFLRGPYMEATIKKVQDIKLQNRKRVIRQINYHDNPVEMLKNCQQRLNISSDKKEYLMRCVELVEKEIENLDNLANGLSLEQQRQTLRGGQLSNLQMTDTFGHIDGAFQRQH